MRLSDERLASILAWPKSPGANGPTFEDLASLIAEVRALRECEEALCCHLADRTLECCVCMDAIAAVRALEDKP